MPRNRIMLMVACFLFALATIVALGVGDVKWAAALIPAGLAFWVGSTLV